MRLRNWEWAAVEAVAGYFLVWLVLDGLILLATDGRRPEHPSVAILAGVVGGIAGGLRGFRSAKARDLVRRPAE